MDGQIEGQVNRWMDEWMGEWWIMIWMNEYWVHVFKYKAIAILIHLFDRYQHKPRQVDYLSKGLQCSRDNRV